MPQMNMFDAKLVEQSGKYSVELGGVSIILSGEKQQHSLKNNVKSQISPLESAQNTSL